jgi:hypothetical protein
MKESESFVTINDNGQRRRISKLEGIAKQLHNVSGQRFVAAAPTVYRSYSSIVPEVRSLQFSVA